MPSFAGATLTTVDADTSSLESILFLTITSVTGVDNVGPQAMQNLGNGQFTLSVSTKGKPDSVTVTSSLNGTPQSQTV
jgi:hypothetical protein